MLSLEQQNAYREQYHALHPGWRPSGEVYEATVRSYLQADARILDFGCGRGGLPEKLSAEMPAVFGVDPDWNSLSEYRAPKVKRTVGIDGQLPFAEASFDLILSSWVLEHLSNPEKAFRDITRMLAPDGRFIFLTPNAQHPLLLLNRTARWLPMLQRRLVPRIYARAEQDTFAVRYRANSARRLRRLGRKAGLRLEQLQCIADPTYIAFSPGLFRLATFAERLLPPRWRIHFVGVFTT